MRDKLKGVCFGEVLFDVFSDHKKIGGAPLNVASRLKSFGIDITVVSAVGNDNEGRELINFLENLQIVTSHIQLKNKYPTGIVNVILNEKGNACYTIEYPAAWDKILPAITITSTVKDADFLVYGSLASRDIVSRNTLKQLLEIAAYKIFDVNLRAPHYAMNTLFGLMFSADFIKFNDDELYEIAGYFNSKSTSLELNIKFIAKKTGTTTICVTLGSRGAILYYDEKFYYNDGFKVDVVDTVGSGDSFLAALIYKLFTDKNPQEAINHACAVGAIVAQSKGANPIISETEINKFVSGL